MTAIAKSFDKTLNNILDEVQTKIIKTEAKDETTESP